MKGRGGHLGHVTSIMSSDFHFRVPESLHIKFGFDWLIGFLEKQSLSLYLNDIGPRSRNDLDLQNSTYVHF